MHALFDSLRSFIKPQSCVIDNPIYQLHYKWTVLILLAFSVMVTARQYFGDPIECMGPAGVPPKLLDTFCWVHTTYSVEGAWRKRVGLDVVYPGVENSNGVREGRVYHTYYQWVCFVLFFQALAFWAPRFIWKMAEGGLTRNLVLGLNSPLLNGESREASIRLLTEYFTANMHLHNGRFFTYAATETLNLLNVVLQMLMLDRFLGNQFSSYGTEVLKFTEWDEAVRFDPMIKIFPRMTKCDFYNFGASGSIERKDALCLLPINVLNEKIFIFLWFWLYLLAVLSALTLLYRALTIFIPTLRVMALNSHCRLSNSRAIKQVLSKGSIGDWFMLDLLAKNMEASNFKELIVRLKEKFETDADAESLDLLKDKLNLLSEKLSFMEKR